MDCGRGVQRQHPSLRRVKEKARFLRRASADPYFVKASFDEIGVEDQASSRKRVFSIS
jgi:hypothetical protein